MSETPPNERVTTRDLILGLHSKVDAVDGRLRSVELTLAREDGERAATTVNVNTARGRFDRRSTLAIGGFGIVMQLPAWLAIMHAGLI